MDEHNQQFENYLREFQPRRPGALPGIPDVNLGWRNRLAAAAVLAFAFTTSAWLLWEKPRHREVASDAKTTVEAPNGALASTSLSLLPLTRMAVEDPNRLDAVLADASRHLLPSLQGKASTLQVLAKE